jgi:hypothetical protein
MRFADGGKDGSGPEASGSEESVEMPVAGSKSRVPGDEEVMMKKKVSYMLLASDVPGDEEVIMKKKVM